eukprot:scaffold7821_cov99-Isochrysis_galbana.AAC.5
MHKTAARDVSSHTRISPCIGRYDAHRPARVEQLHRHTPPPPAAPTQPAPDSPILRPTCPPVTSPPCLCPPHRCLRQCQTAGRQCRPARGG